MNIPNLRSPREKTGGIVYFARMLDKIRLHAEGKLPADYQPNLGIGFDGRCVSFLGITYNDLVARVAQGGSDEEILAWCFTEGRKPSDEQIEVWNAYMSKRGWNDDASAILQRRIQEMGLSQNEVATFFDLIDADEKPA